MVGMASHAENQGHGPCKNKNQAAVRHMEGERAMKTSQSRTTRRKILKAGAGSLLVPLTFASGKAPAQGGRKPFEGVTLNVSCWSSTYPTLLAQYIPEFTAKTGI